MIRVEAAVKRYGALPALDGIDLAIGAGEAFGLLGPNGAGKTTLVRLLATLASPDSGRLSVGGHDTVTAAAEVKRLIGVVFQENNLDRDLTPRQNLSFHARLHRVDAVEETVTAMLVRLGLTERADTPVNGLSGGMRRRLVIGRALLTQPRVLLLDEPTTGLDPAIRRDLWTLIRDIRDQGCTVILTTHYVEEAERLCGRVGIINRGKLVASGTPADLTARFGAERLEDVVVALTTGDPA
ncbi:ABC transporter ATP-binding protein [Magnetospirillum molischianum]|uniref:Daunorubicin resistance ABC transporter ATPase subunit n=1 Tax=Magnetospirillum molischianum DSM 120 TaxID=1150626 RepID=H8FX93_MAGML|nr:ABC transporter ATP-binding protein [Magnetospirillum molischianum]CCG42981.1 Daunorubicin resistance ABC transporter ATPase subunit [Magnetospirillum molischianum DSM 120]